MPPTHDTSLISRKYQDVFGASISPAFADYLAHRADGSGAILGYRRAGTDPLFLEVYLDGPLEQELSARLGRHVARDTIVEIGNFAADNALAMVELWGAAANDLGAEGEIAVATLTAPLRKIFARIGIPITPIAAARRSRLGSASNAWGRYYDADPWVCAGVISDGQQAIAAYLARHTKTRAA